MSYSALRDILWVKWLILDLWAVHTHRWVGSHRIPCLPDVFWKLVSRKRQCLLPRNRDPALDICNLRGKKLLSFILDTSLIAKWVRLDAGQRSGTKHNLVLTESARRGDSHEGPKLLGYPVRGDDHMELKDGKEVRNFMGKREEPNSWRLSLCSRMS